MQCFDVTRSRVQRGEPCGALYLALSGVALSGTWDEETRHSAHSSL